MGSMKTEFSAMNDAAPEDEYCVMCRKVRMSSQDANAQDEAMGETIRGLLWAIELIPEDPDVQSSFADDLKKKSGRTCLPDEIVSLSGSNRAISDIERIETPGKGTYSTGRGYNGAMEDRENRNEGPGPDLTVGRNGTCPRGQDGPRVIPPLPRAGTMWSICEQAMEVGEEGKWWERTGVCIVWESVSGPLARAGVAGGVEPGVRGKGDLRPVAVGEVGARGGEITSGHGDTRREPGHTQPHRWGGVLCRGGAGEMEAEG